MSFLGFVVYDEDSEFALIYDYLAIFLEQQFVLVLEAEPVKLHAALLLFLRNIGSSVSATLQILQNQPLSVSQQIILKVSSSSCLIVASNGSLLLGKVGLDLSQPVVDLFF